VDHPMMLKEGSQVTPPSSLSVYQQNACLWLALYNSQNPMANHLKFIFLEKALDK